MSLFCIVTHSILNAQFLGFEARCSMLLISSCMDSPLKSRLPEVRNQTATVASFHGLLVVMVPGAYVHGDIQRYMHKTAL